MSPVRMRVALEHACGTRTVRLAHTLRTARVVGVESVDAVTTRDVLDVFTKQSRRFSRVRGAVCALVYITR